MEKKTIKIAIIYYSKGNNTKLVAETIKIGLEEIENIEVKSMSLEELDPNYIKEAKAIIFGTPTYYANISWQMKKWFDESQGYNLEGKLGAVFATENHIGGGADTALLTLINHLMVKGMLIYSGGSALGNPYIHLGVVAIKDGDDYQKERAKIFGNRIARKTLELFGNIK
ncbi:flavodoxin family protein [Haliovirga abyssi]|uniref:Flavodoxin n=1 Tax=Haliovirga abyssi TaxID=2996794 RepID=A0AAU9DPQ4_9FUSO|nr:flavodoxin family protein [Haliovirga abyssi]BDU50428.1 flavodoxin [Haliovirga abyssi]